MRITRARPDDLERYLDLLEESAEWLHSRGFGKLAPGTYRRNAHYFRESIARGEVHLAFLDDEIAGTLRLVAEDPTVWPEAGDDALYVHNLIVRRPWSGRGLGRQLLMWAEERAATVRKTWVRLDCFADNLILRKYYENAGFVDRGEIDAQYPFGRLRLQRYERRVNGSG